jgi:cytochrome P450 family 709
MAAPALPLPLAVAAALLALAAAWLWDYAVARHLLRPRAVASVLRAQGVRGPPYRYLRGSNGDVRRMKAEADGAALDARDHDYLPRVVPHFLAWKYKYGTRALLLTCSAPDVFQYSVSFMLLCVNKTRMDFRI